jgi:hypothetical protein
VGDFNAQATVGDLVLTSGEQMYAARWKTSQLQKQSFPFYFDEKNIVLVVFRMRKVMLSYFILLVTKHTSTLAPHEPR